MNKGSKHSEATLLKMREVQQQRQAKSTVSKNFRFTVEFVNALEAFSALTHRTRTDVIVEAVKMYIAVRKNQGIS